jgi:hypothetical protein
LTLAVSVGLAGKLRISQTRSLLALARQAETFGTKLDLLEGRRGQARVRDKDYGSGGHMVFALTLGLVGWSMLGSGGPARVPSAARGGVEKRLDWPTPAARQSDFPAPSRFVTLSTLCLPYAAMNRSVPADLSSERLRAERASAGPDCHDIAQTLSVRIVYAREPLRLGWKTDPSSVEVTPLVASLREDTGSHRYPATSARRSQAPARRWGPCWSCEGLMDWPCNVWGETGLTLSVGYYIIGKGFGLGWRRHSASAGCGTALLNAAMAD